MHRPTFHTVVFTDLDGTLLDDRYDLVAAAAVLNELACRGVLTVPASSKTVAELEAFNRLLDFDPPLISENGAGVAWPQSLQSTVDSPPPTSEQISYHTICEVLAELRTQHRFNFVGFADMSVEQVSSATGLDAIGAALAQRRSASEPIVWSDTAERLTRFFVLLNQQDLTLVQGGRFYHVMRQIDKGQAATSVLKVLRSTYGQRLLALACGDSANDLSMLRMAQACALFPQRDGSYLPMNDRQPVRAKAAGAQGWRSAVVQLLDAFGNEPTRISQYR